MPHQYMKENSAVVTFESESGEVRAFTVAYSHAFDQKGMIGPEMNGLFVIEHGREDDPYQYMLFDGLHRGNKAAALRTLEAVKSKSWPEFAAFVRAAREDLGYRSYEEIIDPQFKAAAVERTEFPEPGNLRNLIALGIVDLPEEEDLRTPEMIEIDDDPDNGLSFPERGYEGMVQDIMKDGWYKSGHYEPLYPAWTVSVPTFDSSGKVGDSKVDADLDEKWAEEFKKNQYEIEDRILDEVMWPYTHEQYSTFPGNDYGRYKFSFSGGDDGVLTLREMDGVDMDVESLDELGEKLDDMPQEDVVRLWKLQICLERDLGEDNLRRYFEQGVNYLRSQWEEDYKRKLEQEGDSPSTSISMG